MLGDPGRALAAINSSSTVLGAIWLQRATWTSRDRQDFNLGEWSIIAVGVVLCPLFVLLTACVIGWSRFRKLWHADGVAPKPRCGKAALQFRRDERGPATNSR
jgi:integral membrane sensor domain MASE1